MGQPAQQAGGAAGDQFYVTHCATADSVLNNPGYTVRASSSADRDALDAAFRYPPYELPIDMWRDPPPPAAAPRRLARTRYPDGGVWAVNSAYLAKDSVDRDRSYFSHLMLLNAAEPVAVLRSWGADGWVTSYPPGAEKQLDRTPLPFGALVSDAALTAFLGDHPPGPTDLSLTVCPSRLRTSGTDRSDLLARVLQALLLLAAEEEPQRRRLYIHAEPGVVALLLYGAVRLLPPAVTDDLTFSTFEPYHRNIRDYKLAEVVGTYIGPPENGKGLDADLGTSRGIALDTIVPARSSRELRAPLAESLPAGIDELIELAARGEWELLPTVRHAMGADPSGLPRVPSALSRARGLARVDAGTAGIDDLLALQADLIGADELKGRIDQVWPIVKAAALDPHRSDVRTAFRSFLGDPERVKGFWDEGFEAVLREDFRTWDSRWAVVREAAGPAEARKYLNRFIGSEKAEGKLGKLPTDVRARLRAACGDVGLLPPRPLLVPVGLGELEPLLGARPEWAGFTAFVLMAGESLNWLAHVPAPGRQQMRKRAREFLLDAPGPALAAYVKHVRPHLEADPKFLTGLFAPYSAGAAKLMDRLLSDDTLEPDDWIMLCTTAGLTQDEWGAFLLERDRLARLLVGLGGEGAGEEVWKGYLDALTPALISPDLIEVADGDDAQVIHDWERGVHTHLRTAAERLTAAGMKLAPALPDGGVARLFAANNLLKWVEKPALAERDGADEVAHACATFAVEPFALVRVAYTRGGYDQLDLPHENARLEPFVALFRAAFPVDAQYQTARAAVSHWLSLSASCPARWRAAFQAYFVLSCVPEVHYPNLLAEARRQSFEPRAEAAIRQAIAAPVKKTGPKPAAKANPFEGEAEEEGDGELPDPDSVGTSRYSKKKRRRAKRGNWLGLAIMVGALSVLIVGGVIAYVKFAKKDAPQQEQKAAPSPQK